MGTTSETIGVAIFGLGRAGKIHVGTLVKTPRARLVWFVDEFPKTAQDVASKWWLNDVSITSPGDAAKVFQDPRVDVVVVTTPTSSHEGIVREAIKHGKGVFCEKPIAGTIAAVKECYSLAQKANVPLFCSFNRRFDPTMKAIYKQLRSGFGKPHMVRTCSRDSDMPSIEYVKHSGGMFHDCAIHDLDMVCWLLGEFPHTVFSAAFTHDPEIAAAGDVDTISTTMMFPSGVIATTDNSRHSSYGYDQRIEVHGQGGMLVSENQYPVSLVQYNSTGTHLGRMIDPFQERYAASYEGAMEHFLNVYQGKEEMMLKPEEIMKVSKLVTAAHLSHETKQPVVLKYDE